MNRPIKFRAKGKYDGQWHYGGLIQVSKGYSIATNKDGAFEMCDVEPSTLGQFSGLLDCNGKEIYEGDFVLIYGYLLCKVVYERSAFVYYELYNTTSSIGISDFCLGECGAYHYVEVVGNIYDDYINELIEKIE